MGVHTNYKPGEILWFLRNYWKYDRNRLIDEYQNHFQDPNFGRSQYTWLRARYGMKEEWGAVLNHPPYSGAVPGGTNTMYYEAAVPTAAPRPNFKRSESPPQTQTQAQTQPEFAPQSQSQNDFAPPQSFFTPSLPSLPSLPAMPMSAPMDMDMNMNNMNMNMAGMFFEPGMAMNAVNMNMPMDLMGNAGVSTAAAATSTSDGHVTGSQHIYSFPMSANFVPFSAVTTSTLAGQGQTAMNTGMDTGLMNYDMNVNNTNMEWGLGIDAYPGFASVSGAAAAAAAAASTTSTKRKRGEYQFDIELREPKRAAVAETLVAADLSLSTTLHQENMARKTAMGRRRKAASAKKDKTRSMSIPEMGSPASTSSDMSRSVSQEEEESGSQGSSPALDTEPYCAVHSQAQEQTRSEEQQQPYSEEQPRPQPQPSASASAVASATTIDPRGEWFDGTHPNCPISLRHRHDSSGGIYVTGSPQQPEVATFESVESFEAEAVETETESPSYEYVPTPEAPTTTSADASFMYATPLSTSASAAPVETVSPAVTSLFGSPQESLSLSVSASISAAVSTSVDALTAPAELLDIASTHMPLDGGWDLAVTDADLGGFWTGPFAGPDGSTVSFDSGALPSPTPTQPLSLPLMSEISESTSDNPMLHYDTFGMPDADVNALLSVIHA